MRIPLKLFVVPLFYSTTVLLKLHNLTFEKAKVYHLESKIAKCEHLENKIQMQDQKIAAQDRTIHALNATMKERFASVENNLEVVNPGSHLSRHTYCPCNNH